MKVYDKTWLKTSVVTDMKAIASRWAFDGRGNPGNAQYLKNCTGFHQPTGTCLLFTRDVGHHASGWWKNPDYEQCLHLSLSFVDPSTQQLAPRDLKLTKEWIRLFFGADASKLWCEPPYSPEGKAREVWHYRLFCTPAWTPIVPRGEVYSRELTEAGWKSYSDVQAEAQAAEKARRERRAGS